MTKEPPAKPQIDKFRDAARELGADDDPERFCSFLQLPARLVAAANASYLMITGQNRLAGSKSAALVFGFPNQNEVRAPRTRAAGVQRRKGLNEKDHLLSPLS